MSKGFITREAGAVLNKSNRNAISSALAILHSVLKAAGLTLEDDSGEDDQKDDDKPKKDATDETRSKSKEPAAKTGSKDASTKESRSARAIAEAAGFSWSDLATLLQNALNETQEAPRDGGYMTPLRVVDIYDDNFVYCVGWSGTEYYRVDYSVAEDGSVTLGPPSYVNRKVTYIAPVIADTSVEEAGAYHIEEDFTRLAEAAVAADGSTLIKLISPGLGSSGYYSPDVLKRDGAAAFPRGTKMYWDHDTLAEERDRPEGTLTRFAAVLEEDAQYLPDHRAGAGLYARAQVFESYRSDLNEIADYIGTSIRADGQAKTGEYNGARVPIITAIKPSNGINNRVDFVTAPGAGGRVLSLFESARQRQPEQSQEGDQTMTDEQIKKLVTEGIAAGVREAIGPLQTEVARLREASTLREARAFADQSLSGPKYASLPATTRQRIAESVSLNVPLTESGAIDAAKLVEAIETAAKTEAGYLSAATGRTFAIGLGESRALTDDGDTTSATDDEAELTAMFERWGHNPESAKIAAAGRR